MLNNLLDLFVSFFKVGSFSFGGAYSLIPLIEKEAVANHNWLTKDEFMQVLGGVEIFPGAISIKFATYTGYKVAGIPGILAANLGNLIIPAIGIILIYYFYSAIEKSEILKKSFSGIKYGIVGIVIAVMAQYSFREGTVEVKSFVFILAGFLLVFFLKMHPALAISLLAVVAVFV